MQTTKRLRRRQQSVEPHPDDAKWGLDDRLHHRSVSVMAIVVTARRRRRRPPPPELRNSTDVP